MEIIRANIKKMAKQKGWTMQDIANELFPMLTKNNSRTRLYSKLNRKKVEPELLRDIAILLDVEVGVIC